MFNVKPVVGFEPDTVVIDDGNDCNGNVHQPGGNGGNAIERAVRGCVQNIVAADGCQPLLLFHGVSLRALGSSMSGTRRPGFDPLTARDAVARVSMASNYLRLILERYVSASVVQAHSAASRLQLPPSGR